jgi:integrase
MGIHPKIVQERLGHHDIGTTMNIYSHVLPNMQEDAMRRYLVVRKTTAMKTTTTQIVEHLYQCKM